jgi:hypothetical protein
MSTTSELRDILRRIGNIAESPIMTCNPKAYNIEAENEEREQKLRYISGIVQEVLSQ